MVSKKSKPIKKVNKSHKHSSKHKTEHKVVEQKSNYWMYATFALAILLVISVATKGFYSPNIGSVETSLSQLITKESSEAVKAHLNDALTSLSEAKTQKEAETVKEPNNFDGEQVELEFYVMSQCPYGTQVEDAVKPALDKLGDAVDFKLNFISTDLGDGTFRSLHGESETKGNIVQLCAAKYNPDKYMDMIVCMNKNAGAIPGNWENCANDNGLDVENIRTCYEGVEGKQLLSESAKKSVEANARGSPTMFLNGEPYNSGRDTLSFLRALCNELDDHPECSSLPACSTDADCSEEEGKIGKCVDANTDEARCEYIEPKQVNMIYLTDSECTECQQYDSLVGQLETIFKGLEVTEMDFADQQGRALYDQLDLSALPAFLFDESVEEGEGYANVQRYLVPVGDYRSLSIGATYSPLREICDNGIDDRDQDGLVDCDDDECSGEWQCMEKKEVPEVELFVMSHCPFGTQMEKGMLPVVELLGDEIDFNLRFVYYAMHGEVEVEEQSRQYCIQLEQEDKFIPYLKCFLEDGDSDRCLSETDIDTEMMESCVARIDEEFDITANFEDTSSWLNGRYPLFNTDKEANEKYAVGGSPTLVINGVTASTARDPASILDAVCVGFEEKPAECDEELSATAYGSGFGFDAAASGASATASCG